MTVTDSRERTPSRGPIFDDDLFDAEIIVSRWGGEDFDAHTLGQILGSPTPNAARQKVLRLRHRGEIPAPSRPGNGCTRDYWTKRQVVGIVAERLRRGARSGGV